MRWPGGRGGGGSVKGWRPVQQGPEPGGIDVEPTVQV